MSSRPFVGQIRTEGFITLEIVAIASKYDTFCTTVILEKAVDSDNYHVVSEITTNPPIGRNSVLIHTNRGEDGQIMTSGEKALQDWMERSFGVNIF